MIWGVLPLQTSVSWESHLFGAIVGFLVSYAFRDIVEPDDDITQGNVQSFRINRQVNIDKSNRPYFLPRYAFDGLREKYNAPPPPEFEPENEENTPPNSFENPVTQQVYDEWLVMREKLRLNENWQNVENHTENHAENQTTNLENPQNELTNGSFIDNNKENNNSVNNDVNNDNSIKKTPPNPNGWYTSNTTWD
jgi:hypothetical protein